MDFSRNYQKKSLRDVQAGLGLASHITPGSLGTPAGTSDLPPRVPLTPVALDASGIRSAGTARPLPGNP